MFPVMRMSKNLLSNWIGGLVIIARNRHFIAGSNPAISVAVEEDLTGD